MFPSAARPELRPFSAEELQAAFALQPGAYELPEVHALPVTHGFLAEGEKPPSVLGSYEPWK